MPNNTTKVKKITGVDDNVVALTVDQDNNIYYVTNEHQAYIYYNKDGSIVQIKGLNDKLDDNPITGLALDSNNNLYLGTFVGLYCLSAKLLTSAAEGPVAKKMMKNLIRKFLLLLLIITMIYILLRMNLNFFQYSYH